MANTYLTRTHGTPTNAYKGTLSYWQKAASTNATNYILACESGSERMLFYLTQGKFQAGLRGTSAPPDIDFTVSGLPRFRDVSAWYHVVLAWDSTQSTASDRMKLYVNNVQYTWSGSGTSGVNDVPQNHVMPMNKSGLPFRIGSTIVGGDYFEGIMSHIHFCDGTQYQASDFGEYDANGVWKIKTEPSVTYGNNGFWWLKDTNSATDSSPNSNTPTIGGTLTKTEDNPSNVFATLNPLVPYSSNYDFYNGNTTVENDGNAADWTTRWGVSTLGMTAGKYYAEAKVAAIGTNQMYALGLVKDVGTFTPTSSVGTDGVGYYSNGGIYNLSSQTQTTATYTTNDIIGLAFDATNGTAQWYKNGSAVGTTETGLSTDGTWFFVTNQYTNGKVYVNYGNGYFGSTAVSSAGTNASGNGIFEYDVPTGFTALSTKGLNL